MQFRSGMTAALGLMALLLGCSSARKPAATTPTALTPAPAPTNIPFIASVSPAADTPTAILPAGPPTAAGSIYVEVSADNVNLRTGPGTVFPVSRLLTRGTRLQLDGRAPGGEWLYVRMDSNIDGWVLSWLVNGGRSGGAVPLVQPQGVQVIQGSVVDRAGAPISGIGFAVTQGIGLNAPRTDATTDAAGQFYAYVPASATGEWYVTYVSVACTSNTMDANCNCIGTCGTAQPPRIAITLPTQSTLQFTWK